MRRHQNPEHHGIGCQTPNNHVWNKVIGLDLGFLHADDYMRKKLLSGPMWSLSSAEEPLSL